MDFSIWTAVATVHNILVYILQYAQFSSLCIRQCVSEQCLTSPPTQYKLYGSFTYLLTYASSNECNNNSVLPSRLRYQYWTTTYKCSFHFVVDDTLEDYHRRLISWIFMLQSPSLLADSKPAKMHVHRKNTVAFQLNLSFKHAFMQ